MTHGTDGEFTGGSTLHLPLWSAVKKPTTLDRNQRLQTHDQILSVDTKAVGSLYS